ncbi:MAG TPA: Gfo/Idh/MocA family oxidoreductase [Bacteroidales bacterium]|nr:Gfo/Idh/MocA family oxidoreductase [Bacteroidales bacterium]HPT03193.1 Gfo/Idh/MocA family oxidoreductase [Bacteroidales bacterium]
MNKKNTSKGRRDFLKLTAMGTVAASLAPLSGAFASPSGNEAEILPAPPAPQAPKPGRKSVMGLACEPIETVRIGIIGLGMRGSDAVRRLLQIEGVKVMALCDVLPERVKESNETVTGAGQEAAIEFSGEEGWKKVCEREDIDLIYTCTPWYLHTPIAVYAMKNGKHIATEVPAAMTLNECWQLVNTAEETQRHCMMLENCCYDFFELATLNMARDGIFGEILHGEGAYIHDLRWLKFAAENKGGYYHQWRLEYSKKHNGNLYPTHGLGPVAQIMGINRGDRLDFLTSMSTKQAGLSLYAAGKFGAGSPEALQEYKLGDMNITMLHTIKGHTIMIQHDTTSPRPYSRIHMISGTKGMAVKYPEQNIALEPSAHEFLKKEDLDALLKKYEHPLAQQIGEKARKVGGHGGMDFIMDYRLIYCLRKGLPLDQDVYDAATWSCIVPLSEISVEKKSRSIEIPDFTRGAWQTAQPWPVVTIE